MWPEEWPWFMELPNLDEELGPNDADEDEELCPKDEDADEELCPKDDDEGCDVLEGGPPMNLAGAP